MSVASCGCDATFAGMAACHCLQVPPLGLEHDLRRLRSPTDRPTRPTDGWPALPAPGELGMEPLGDRGWGWAARDDRVTQDPVGAIDEVAIGAKTEEIPQDSHSGRPNGPLCSP